jgi:hypothetical protein
VEARLMREGEAPLGMKTVENDWRKVPPLSLSHFFHKK